jgi:hypothetical protein
VKPRLLDLPHGHQVALDEADLPLVQDLTLYCGTNGYVYFSTWEDGRSIPRTLHGLLMAPPKGSHVDHINGDKLDNRRANLRVVTPQRNQVNRKRLNQNNTSGVRGVRRHGQCDRWVAQITVARKNVYLGLFERFEDAVAARRAAELQHYGELCP